MTALKGMSRMQPQCVTPTNMGETPVLIDTSTVHSAHYGLSLLKKQKFCPLTLETKTHDETQLTQMLQAFRKGPWSSVKSELATKFVAEVSAINLIEAAVLHENLYFDDSTSSKDSAEVVALLQGIVKPLMLPTETRNAVMSRTLEASKDYAKQGLADHRWHIGFDLPLVLGHHEEIMDLFPAGGDLSTMSHARVCHQALLFTLQELPLTIKEPCLAKFLEHMGKAGSGEHESFQREEMFLRLHIYRLFHYATVADILELPYIPHPVRAVYWEDQSFMQSIQRDIISQFEWQVRRNLMEKIGEAFKALTFDVNVPMVYNLVRRRAEKTGDIVSATIEVRHSPEATAFRAWCANLIAAAREGNLSALENAHAEMAQLTRKWSAGLRKAFSETRKLKIKLLGIDTDIEIPVPRLARFKRHLVFLYRLVTTG